MAWTCFYDDYTMVSRSDCTSNAGWAAECLFDLLGIIFAKEGKKATNFDKIFGTLGVIFDLTTIQDKAFSLTHTHKLAGKNLLRLGRVPARSVIHFESC